MGDGQEDEKIGSFEPVFFVFQNVRQQLKYHHAMDASKDWTLSGRAHGETYIYRELCSQVLSPGAIGVLDQLREPILRIYDLQSLLDTHLLRRNWEHHEEKLTGRLTRIVATLPRGTSPMPNEVFTAIEFLCYEVEQRPVLVGEALIRLEALADEIRANPLLHSLVTGRAN